MSLIVNDLLCEWQVNPKGITCQYPSFRWIFHTEERNCSQKAYRILVWDEFHTIDSPIWDSGCIYSTDSNNVLYSGEPLQALTVYYWCVQVETNRGEKAWSEVSQFETAFMNWTEWKADWIEPEQKSTYVEEINYYKSISPQPQQNPDLLNLWKPHFIRKEFSVDKKIKKARIYITAHGVYKLYVDGLPASRTEFNPGFTPYHKMLQYQTYDITDLCGIGEHVIGIVLADGWYAGRIGGPGDSAQYGDKLGITLQTLLVYDDDTEELIVSDESFKSTTGPFIYSDLYIGEKYDARLELGNWCWAGYDDTNWKAVKKVLYDNRVLCAECVEPVEGCEELPAVKLLLSPNGEQIIDFGQVIAGVVEMKISGAKPGTRIDLYHTEVLTKEGNYINNIQGRFKNQQDTYICKGGEEKYRPQFTFHGFRYVYVVGYPGNIQLENFKAIAIHNTLKKTGEFECSNENLTQLQKNIVWSQMGNMLSIPTDCPQRERAGWTGDVQIFASTAVFNRQMMAFFKTWLKECRYEQLEDGQIPDVVPYMPSCHICSEMRAFGVDTDCSAGWGDVVTILPSVLYNTYGDKRILEENYDMMKKWVNYIEKTAYEENPSDIGEMSKDREERLKYIWNTHFHFGDWLAPSASFDPQTGEKNEFMSALLTKKFVPTCFYAYSTDLLSKAAATIGNREDEIYYRNLNDKIRKAFAEEYINGQGEIDTNFQGVYVLALKMGLVPEEKRSNIVKKLIDLIRENDTRLDTGFLSTPFLLDVLCESGYENVAYDILLQNKMPSWLYEVEHGATTIWESWHAMDADGTPTQSSYNHYAYGCIGDWMYRNIGGIWNLDVAYKKIGIKITPDERITWANTEYETVYGVVKCSWKREDGVYTFDITVPPNTTALVYSPVDEEKNIEVESGNYQFIFD